MPSSSPPRQARISSFFSPTQPKRPASPTTLDGRSPEPPLKKKKGVKSGPSESAEQWRFTGPASPEQGLPNAEAVARRKAFKKKLLPATSSRTQPKATEEPLIIAVSDDDSDHVFTEFSELVERGKSEKVTRKSKAVEEIGPGGETWTPLEKQVPHLNARHILRLKKDNPGAVLMVEVGYKFKFFGEDAKVAAKELGMVCFRDRNFLVAGIPTHRRDIHLKKLLSQGYKVGIVEQVETAALKKAGDNRNAPFERKLVQMFTAATYVDDLDSIDELDKYTSPRLVCIIESEKATTTGVDVCIGMISVSPSVGDVVWDVFDDTPMRIELDTRLVHSKPAELLLPRNGLSKPTERMLKHFSQIRNEYFDEAMPFSKAFEFVSSFYQNSGQGSRRPAISGEDMHLPKLVIIALASTMRYLPHDMAATLSQTSFFTKFATQSHMLLASNTLTNLEIFQNETDYTTRGSLVWILDKTVTRFGARMLRTWVAKPLVDKLALQERIEAVEEIVTSPSDKLASLRQLLKRLPDLAKGLCRIQYKQCTPRELAILLPAFYKIGTAFTEIQTSADVGLKSRLLNEIIMALPRLKNPMGEFLDAIHIKQTSDGRKDGMWKDPSKFPLVEDHKSAIEAVEFDLDQELAAIRKTLKMPSLKYTTVAGEDYLIEVKKADNRPIPASYHPAVSKTKYVERYRSPKVKEKLQERARCRESLQIEAKKAFLVFLDEINVYYAIVRDAVNKLAVADCLMSLAQVALQENYVKPQFTDGNESNILEVVDGRHPMVEALRSDPFVPNTMLFTNESRAKIISGPNLGGKSSCVRMVALIAIMAQIGSYVPATSVKLAPLDSVQTRMGAYDEIARGRSTFMVEMTETSEILHTATLNSLVILDELGRGTSTFDGMAIAFAVLEKLVSIRCKTLFITHYPLVATELEEKFPERVQNMHVGYHTEKRGIDGRRDVTFLYRLTKGVARESFGVECARLAGLPESILANATTESLKMEKAVADRVKQNTKQLSPAEAASTVEKLRSLRCLPPTHNIQCM
ncbi:muts domain V-domain-containing protein [Mycena galericulata]|nr:muts domain V-domain-containing protein [Mycena galericulata]